MPSGSPIPPRVSSKHTLNDLERINEELKRKRRKLRSKVSSDAQYWTIAVDVVKTEMSRNAIRRQISMNNFNSFKEDIKNWTQADEAQRLLTEYEVLKLKEKKLEIQVERFESDDNSAETSLRCSYLELFLSSTQGLGTDSGAGAGDSSRQIRFRRDLIEAYDAGWKGNLWCPILAKWVSPSTITASHIFGFHHGQQTMDAIFGKTEPSELFDTGNGLLLFRELQAKFDLGLFVIVPDVPEDPTIDQISQWQQVNPKEYKVKIIDRDPTKINRPFPELGDDRTWANLDGRRLKFRSTFRPRARYLYYSYCLQILRLAVKERYQSEILRENELGKPFWGSPGKYVKKNMLLFFVQEVSHRYGKLIEGSLETDEDLGPKSQEGDDDDNKDLLFLVATKDIDLGNGSTRVLGEEESSDEEEESESDI